MLLVTDFDDIFKQNTALKISMTISLCVYVFMCMRSLEFIFGCSFETRE